MTYIISELFPFDSRLKPGNHYTTTAECYIYIDRHRGMLLKH